MGNDTFHGANEPIYFMTDDDVTRGLNQINVLGEPYKSVKQPNHIETVIAQLPTGDNNERKHGSIRGILTIHSFGVILDAIIQIVQ